MNSSDEKSQIELPVSKSQRKREMHERQALGEQLVKLTHNQLQKVPLPSTLLDAVAEAQKITSHGAHKRQLQYIGRLMRDIDVGPIIQQLEAFKQQSSRTNRHFHALEKWRERLINEGDEAVTELITIHPTLDVQHLRQLIRKARKEKLSNATPRAAREIFQLLRENLEDDD